VIAGQTCETCRFFQKTGAAGECRRHAPLPMLRADLYEGKVWDGCFDGFWPTVATNEFCGEWGPLPVVQKPEAIR
jgi:hypothetical protein